MAVEAAAAPCALTSPYHTDLSVYFGDDDRVVSFEAGKQFVDQLKADDKTFIPVRRRSLSSR